MSCAFDSVINKHGMLMNDRHSAEELEAMDEDEDIPPSLPKLSQRFVNGA